MKFHRRGDSPTPPKVYSKGKEGSSPSTTQHCSIPPGSYRTQGREETHSAERLMCVPPVRPINEGSVFRSHGGEMGLTTPTPPPHHPHNSPPRAKELLDWERHCPRGRTDPLKATDVCGKGVSAGAEACGWCNVSAEQVSERLHVQMCR